MKQEYFVATIHLCGTDLFLNSVVFIICLFSRKSYYSWKCKLGGHYERT